MDFVQAFMQYAAEQLSYYKDREYFEVSKFINEIFGAYKFVKSIQPTARYQLQEYMTNFLIQLNIILDEKDKETFENIS